MYNDDRIGIRHGVSRSSYAGRASHASIGVAQHADKAGMGVAGWDDPLF
jgi:hypothetical protein